MAGGVFDLLALVADLHVLCLTVLHEELICPFSHLHFDNGYYYFVLSSDYCYFLATVCLVGGSVSIVLAV